MRGEELRSLRKGLGWTLAKLAEQLGMSETYVGQMERTRSRSNVAPNSRRAIWR